MSNDQVLRDHLRNLLTKQQAHVTLDGVLKDFPLDKINERPHDLPYSAYELLWHLRFTQRDILNFVQDDTYHDLNWPDDYWPHTQSATEADWQDQVKAYHTDMQALLKVLDDPKTDLYTVVPNGKDQTFLREFMLVADHNAYHTAELMVFKRLLGGKTAS